MNPYVVDVSYYSIAVGIPGRLHGVDFSKALAAGCMGVMIKAGQGDSRDAAFGTFWALAGDLGISRGTYWIYDPGVAVEFQAEAWAERVGKTKGEMESFISFERIIRAGEVKGRNTPHDWERFLELCHKALPEAPIGIHTTRQYFTERHDGSPSETWSQYPLWITSFGGASPALPTPWKEYAFWRFAERSSGGEEYGLSGKSYGLSVFSGNQQEFTRRYRPEEKNKIPLVVAN